MPFGGESALYAERSVVMLAAPRGGLIRYPDTRDK